MMPFIFLFLGLFFIFLEFYLPGAVMGIIGAIMLVVSIIFFADQVNSAPVTLLYGLAVVGCVIVLIKRTLHLITKAKPGYSIYLNADQEGFRASTYDKNAIGKKGIVIADLKPGGYILVDGKKQAAISKTGYIAQNEEVIVIGGDGESLIVKTEEKT